MGQSGQVRLSQVWARSVVGRWGASLVDAFAGSPMLFCLHLTTVLILFGSATWASSGTLAGYDSFDRSHCPLTDTVPVPPPTHPWSHLAASGLFPINEARARAPHAHTPTATREGCAVDDVWSPSRLPESRSGEHCLCGGGLAARLVHVSVAHPPSPQPPRCHRHAARPQPRRVAPHGRGVAAGQPRAAERTRAHTHRLAAANPVSPSPSRTAGGSRDVERLRVVSVVAKLRVAWLRRRAAPRLILGPDAPSGRAVGTRPRRLVEAWLHRWVERPKPLARVLGPLHRLRDLHLLLEGLLKLAGLRPAERERVVSASPWGRARARREQHGGGAARSPG